MLNLFRKNKSDVGPEMLWDPARHAPSTTRLAEFARFVGFKGKCDQAGYKALNDWAASNPEKFWSAVWDFCGMIGDKGPTVIQKIDQVPWARFFPDSKISFAENMLAGVGKTPNAPAIIARTQDGPDRVISWKELYDHVSLWEQALRGAGIGEGDVVATYLPNIPETVILLIATSQVGAVFTSAGMEMGPDDFIARVGQSQPKILITQEAYPHGAKMIDRKGAIERAKNEIFSIEKIVFLAPHPPASPTPSPHGGEGRGEGRVTCEDFLAPYKPEAINFIRRDFNQPLYILFSSGSTGKPKCFVHGVGGTLLKQIEEHQLNSDIRAGDVLFYHATPSWMMWNWLASGLASNATILMYDGNPAYPNIYAQWDFTSAHKCTHHGTAAPVILSWATAKAEISKRCDLKDLRVILSTGAVLPAQGFEFIHAHVKSDVKISSISGGTDIVACFLGGNPWTPTYAAQVNGPMLGCDVEAWNEDGVPVKTGETGELVCKNPFPSMPLRFMDDPQGEKYRAEYFDSYKESKNHGPHIWRHGDSLEKTPEGQLIIIGRSDATLKQNGVRIGPAAIYDQLKPFADKIKEAAAVDFTRPDNKQALTVLFIALNDGASVVPDDMQAAIRKAVKDNVTPYAIPTEIIAVPGVLKTPNGKTGEVVIKKILAGKTIPNPTLYGADLVKVFEGIGEELKKKYS